MTRLAAWLVWSLAMAGMVRFDVGAWAVVLVCFPSATLLMLAQLHAAERASRTPVEREFDRIIDKEFRR